MRTIKSKKIKNILLLLSCIFNAACNNIQKGEIPVLNLCNYKQLSLTNISLMEIAESIKIVPLETNDSVLVSTIYRIRIEKDKLFIYARNGVFVFESTGKFLNKVGSKGRGPIEYLGLYDIFPKDNYVWLLDQLGHKALQFTTTGDFMQIVELGHENYTDFYYTTNECFICFLPDLGQSNTDIMLSFFDISGLKDSVQYKKPIKGDVLQRFVYREGSFFQHGDQIKFKHLFNDTIYNILNNQMSPNMVLNLGIGKANENARADAANKGDDYNLFQGMYIAHILGENDRYIYLLVESVPLFYDKKERKLHKWKLILPQDERLNIEESKKFVPSYIDKNGNLIGETVSANEEDNPVIIIAKLKGSVN